MQNKGKNKTQKDSLELAISDVHAESKTDITAILKGFTAWELLLIELLFNEYSIKEIASQLNMTQAELRLKVNHLKAKLVFRAKKMLTHPRVRIQTTATAKNDEIKLINKINSIFPVKERQRYDYLYAKFQQDNIAEKEYAELVKLSEEFESLNAKKMKYISKLARLRGTAVEETIQEFAN
jgi:hypothetical protein